LFTTSLHWSLSLARWIQATSSHSVSLRSILTLPSHPASYPVGTKCSFPGGKAAGHEAATNLHVVQRSRMRGAVLPLPQNAFMAWCSVKKHRDNFTFTLLISTPRSSKWSLLFRFSNRNILSISHISVHATCPAISSSLICSP
jgi:hypothetical protein